MIDYTLPLDQLPDPLPIAPLTQPFDVSIAPPGSKSITCRAYVLAALAQGESKLIRPLRADDTELLLDALCTLGAEARWVGDDVYIKGVGGRFPRGGEVNLGDGGTPTRFMIACACLAAQPVIVDGSKRMRERPIAEGVAMLRQLGAQIEYVEEEGRLPVRVTPSEKFHGGHLNVGQTASSQFISALLLIGSQLRDGITLSFTGHVTSASYVYLTTWTMEQWAIELEFVDADCSAAANGIQHAQIIVPPCAVAGGVYTVEPDASSCAYWHAAAAIHPGSRAVVPIQPLASNQPDRNVGLEIVTTFGGSFEFVLNDAGLATSSAVVGPAQLIGENKEIDAAQMPDGAVALAVVCACAKTPVTIRGLHTLRVKETDRIAALANELGKVGCTVETGADWITIHPHPHAVSDDRREEDTDSRGPKNGGIGDGIGGERLGDGGSGGGSGPSLRSDMAFQADPALVGKEPVVIETYNDHRMAMAFAVLGLVRPGIAIRNPACVAKSYPTFWKDFAKLYQQHAQT